MHVFTQRILDDPCVRDRVKRIVRELLNADPVDAMNDLALIRSVMQAEIRELN